MFFSSVPIESSICTFLTADGQRLHLPICPTPPLLRFSLAWRPLFLPPPLPPRDPLRTPTPRRRSTPDSPEATLMAPLTDRRRHRPLAETVTAEAHRETIPHHIPRRIGTEATETGIEIENGEWFHKVVVPFAKAISDTLSLLPIT